MVTTLPTSSESKAQKQAKMAGSPKKATKKKATKAKAKADKPKKPLSGYMKFVKGEYMSTSCVRLAAVFILAFIDLLGQPAFALMPTLECEWSIGRGMNSMAGSACNNAALISWSVEGHNKNYEIPACGRFES